MDEHAHIALGLVKSSEGWLVSRRAGGRVFAGLWEFPGGKIETGESPQAAAVREVQEETGLIVEPIAELGELWSFNAGAMVTLYLIHCRWLSGIPAACDPAVEEVRWVSLEELESMPMPPVNAEIIQQLRNLERSG